MLIGMLQLDGLDRVGPTVGPTTGRFYVIYTLIVEQGLALLFVFFRTFLVRPYGAPFVVIWVWPMYRILSYLMRFHLSRLFSFWDVTIIIIYKTYS